MTEQKPVKRAIALAVVGRQQGCTSVFWKLFTPPV